MRTDFNTLAIDNLVQLTDAHEREGEVGQVIHHPGYLDENWEKALIELEDGTTLQLYQEEYRPLTTDYKD